MDSITKRLAYLMKRKNIKAVDLAAETAVNASTISRILKGVQVPASDTLYKFAQYFNVSMEYLLTGKDTVYENCVLAKLTQEEAQLLECYNSMEAEDQEELLMIAQIKTAKRKGGGKTASSKV